MSITIIISKYCDDIIQRKRESGEDSDASGELSKKELKKKLKKEKKKKKKAKLDASAEEEQEVKFFPESSRCLSISFIYLGIISCSQSVKICLQNRQNFHCSAFIFCVIQSTSSKKKKKKEKKHIRTEESD